jgi:hypothetical protein
VKIQNKTNRKTDSSEWGIKIPGEPETEKPKGEENAKSDNHVRKRKLCGSGCKVCR